MLQMGTFNQFGYSLPGIDVYTLGGHPAIGWQSFGAMTAFCYQLDLDGPWASWRNLA